MKQPIYEEIIFESAEYEDVLSAMNKHKIGKAPFYALTDHFDTAQADLLLANIKMILIEKKIHPCFPYPFYIVTEREIDDEFIPIIYQKSELPSFFNHKLKRLRKKESNTLQKSHILVEKINNLNIPHKQHQLNEKIKLSKKLNTKTRELYFYQKIYNKLQLHES